MIDWHRLLGLTLADYFYGSGYRVEVKKALWELFNHEPSRVVHGIERYRWHQGTYNTILHQLYNRYQKKGVVPMTYTIEDLRRDVALEVLHEHPELLAKIPPDERLEGIPPEERLKGIRPEGRLKGLSAKDLERLRRLLSKRPPSEPH